MIIQYLWRSQLEILMTEQDQSDQALLAKSGKGLEKVVQPSPLLSREEIAFIMSESQRSQLTTDHRQALHGLN